MAGAWLKALKALSKKSPTEDDLDKISAEVFAEKLDRGAALVAATYLEESLRRLVMSRMVPLSETEVDALFDRDAPLSSFSKLIRIAHAFGIIDADVRRQCDCIREVRNTFAHSPCALYFDTPEIKTACELLPSYFEEFPHRLDERHPRALYIGACTHFTAVFNEARVQQTE